MGFNLGRSLQQAEQLTDFAARTKKDYERRTNPAGAHLQEFLQLQDQLGDVDIMKRPELLGQFLRSKGVQEGDVGKSIELYQGLRGRQVNKRMNDYRKHVGKAVEEFQQQQAEQKLMLLMLKKANADPGMTQALDDFFKQSSQRRYQQMLGNLSVGYEDLADLPEYHELNRRLQMEGTLGQGSAGQENPLAQSLQAPGAGAPPPTAPPTRFQRPPNQPVP